MLFSQNFHLFPSFSLSRRGSILVQTSAISLRRQSHCLLECRSLHVLQRKKNHRILIHPLLAQPLVVHYLETCKQLPAVLADIEKLGQHGHEQ